jgi:hypothetical protein
MAADILALDADEVPVGADHLVGLRPADGGKYAYYTPGLEQLAFYVDTREEVDDGWRVVSVASVPFNAS